MIGVASTVLVQHVELSSVLATAVAIVTCPVELQPSVVRLPLCGHLPTYGYSQLDAVALLLFSTCV